MARKRKRNKRDEDYISYIFPFGLGAEPQAMVIHFRLTLEGFIGERKEKQYYKVTGKRFAVPRLIDWLNLSELVNRVRGGCPYSSEVDFQNAVEDAFDDKPYKTIRPRLEGFCKENSLKFKLVVEKD